MEHAKILEEDPDAFGYDEVFEKLSSDGLSVKVEAGQDASVDVTGRNKGERDGKED